MRENCRLFNEVIKIIKKRRLQQWKRTKNELVAVNGEAAEIAETHTGMSTGAAMLIGGGLAVAGIAAVKKLRKVLKNRKTKKYVQDNVDYNVNDDTVEDDFDEEE